MAKWEFQGYDPEYEMEMEEERQLQLRNAHAQDVADATAAVKLAIAAFYRQKWYHTWYAKVRFGLYWATYWVRLKLWQAGVSLLGWNPVRSYTKLGL